MRYSPNFLPDSANEIAIRERRKAVLWNTAQVLESLELTDSLSEMLK
jgi:hypothetical protein